MALLLSSPAGSFSGRGHLSSSWGRGRERSPLLSLPCSLLAVTGLRRGPRPRAHVALKAPAVATPDLPGPQLREGVLEELRWRRGQAPGQKAALLSTWATPLPGGGLRTLTAEGCRLFERFLWSPEACSVSRQLTRCFLLPRTPVPCLATSKCRHQALRWEWEPPLGASGFLG